MCGRAYETYTDEELYIRYLSREPEIPLGSQTTYNLCPTQDSPVLRVVSGERQLDLMRWQLVPSTQPEFTTNLSTINARSEGVFESRLYGDLVLRQRCIVPLSGFFEWKREGARKRPFKIQLRGEPIMSVAGIWETWRSGTAEARHSFSILTTAANELMSTIHDRMPVILGREDEGAWLDPEVRARDVIRKMMRPCPSDWMDAIEVSTLVNSPRNNSPAVLEPASPSGSRTMRTLFD